MRTSRAASIPTQKSERTSTERLSPSCSASWANWALQPPTVISMPLWKKSMKPSSSSVRSRNRSRALPIGNPWACFGGGNRMTRKTPIGITTRRPKTARMDV